MILYIASVIWCLRWHPEFYKENSVCCRYFELYCHLGKKNCGQQWWCSKPVIFHLSWPIAQGQPRQPLHVPLLCWSTFLNYGCSWVPGHSLRWCLIGGCQCQDNSCKYLLAIAFPRKWSVFGLKWSQSCSPLRVTSFLRSWLGLYTVQGHKCRCMASKSGKESQSPQQRQQLRVGCHLCNS